MSLSQYTNVHRHPEITQETQFEIQYQYVIPICNTNPYQNYYITCPFPNTSTSLDIQRSHRRPNFKFNTNMQYKYISKLLYDPFPIHHCPWTSRNHIGDPILNTILICNTNMQYTYIQTLLLLLLLLVPFPIH